MAAEKHTVTYHVWAVCDLLGNVHIQISEETGDHICIDAALSHERVVHFESDAYHLEQWCEEHGFGYFHKEQDIVVKVTFDA